MEENGIDPLKTKHADNESHPRVSFKSMLQGSTSGHQKSVLEKNVNPLYEHHLEESDESDDDMPSEDLDEDSKCPVILLSKEEKKTLRKPWKISLIIKMFDKNIGYMTLMRRLSKKWQLKGEFSLTDVGCSYYIDRFSNLEDYNHVLLNGQWLIDDHYLTIRTWVPNFIPDNEPIKFLTAWVRIPHLAVEYFDSSFLHRVGSKIERVIKVDKTTAMAERGKCTRLCIEIDLSKPLLSKFWLKGKIWKIQYEGLILICYNCGRINHKEEDCPELIERQEKQSDDPHNHQNDIHHERQAHPEHMEDFGSWMLVKKPTRTRAQPKAKKPSKTRMQNPNQLHPVKEKNVEGS